MGCWCLHPERVKMGQGSRWASVIYSLKKSKWGLLLFTPWQSQTNSEQQARKKQTAGSKWAKSQNGAKVIMGCCCLPPDRVKQAVNSKKETNSRVKMGKASRWASVIYPLKKSKSGMLLFTPWQSQTNNEQQEKTNSRVKMGKESKWAKGQDGLLFFTPWQSQTSSEQQARKNKQQGQNVQRVKMGFCYLPPDKVKMGAAAVYPLTESN